MSSLYPEPFDPASYPQTAELTALGSTVTSERGFLMGPFATRPGQWVSAYITEAMAGESLSTVDRVTAFTGDGVDAGGGVSADDAA